MSSSNPEGQSYRDKLRQLNPLVAGTRSSKPRKPNWTEQIETGWKPLFEVLTAHDEPIEDPDEELERIRNAAYRDGYTEGLQRGKEAVNQVMQNFHASIAELETFRDRILVETEEELVSLSLLVVQEILQASSESAREFTIKMTEHVLKELREADRITLRVSPTDYQAVMKRHEEMVSDRTVVRIISDPSIAVGGVIADSDLGRVDARIERRLQDVSAQLLGLENVSEGA